MRGEYSSNRRAIFKSRELPPRARRIHTPSEMVRLESGTTSACAENTKVKAWLGAFFRNYLRVRGEYPPRYHPRSANQELPPRARRIRGFEEETNGQIGTTSACAENTFGLNPQINLRRNYLRVRGEYTLSPIANSSVLELPPRARRIHLVPNRQLIRVGTTSACAENTGQTIFSTPPWWNYLRVRGEYRRVGHGREIRRELPPRARRIPWDALGAGIKYGTTSACAENTGSHLAILPFCRNYLRVRGEYTQNFAFLAAPPELPPRARRILDSIYLEPVNNGTTSACAENTCAEHQ